MKLEDYMALRYSIELVPDNEQGGYCILHPELPGCISQGETIQEALLSLEDSKKIWLEVSLEQGLTIPKPSEYGVSHELHEAKKTIKKLEQEVANQSKAASHWMKEANKEHNINIKIRNLIENIEDMIEKTFSQIHREEK